MNRIAQLRRIAELLVTCHGQSFAQHDGCLAVSVHSGLPLKPGPEVAVSFLIFQQPCQACGDILFVGAVFMSLASPQHGQQGERSSHDVAFVIIPIVQAIIAQTPAAVLVLHRRQPANSACDGGLSDRGAPFFANNFRPDARVPSGKGHRLIGARRDVSLDRIDVWQRSDGLGIDLKFLGVLIGFLENISQLPLIHFHFTGQQEIVLERIERIFDPDFAAFSVVVADEG